MNPARSDPPPTPQAGTPGAGNAASIDESGGLVRGLGLLQATALNVSNMVGIGPFITIPLFIAAMGGPHALVGWVVAAVLVLCDGLVWSELGAALPGSGGTYHFLREVFGRYRWGRIMPFLFIWQFLISGTLEMASGYIGSVDYLKYVFPSLEQSLVDRGIPGGLSWLAAGACIAVTAVLCRRIQIVGWLGVALCVGTIATVLTMIVAGLAHFNTSLLEIPPNAFRMDRKFASGLGAAMLIAIYDYLGYYNICHLGDEVRDPGRTIPRAVIVSVIIVATIYLTMNVCIIAVVPWQQAMVSQNIAAQFMETLFGRNVAVAFTWLILWTVAACMFAITLGYSRIPYAAARNGDFFGIFAYLHPRDRYPVVSLLAIGGLTAVFCFFPLQDVITAAVTVRIVVQFVGQIVALHVLRVSRPDIRLPFRMWLYPIPSLVALAGWLFVLATSGWSFVLAGIGVVASGCNVYAAWQSIANGRQWLGIGLLGVFACMLMLFGQGAFWLGLTGSVVYAAGLFTAIGTAAAAILTMVRRVERGLGDRPAWIRLLVRLGVAALGGLVAAAFIRGGVLALQKVLAWLWELVL
jgi:amino acid transporter